jgi:hypothetical protein
MHLCSSVIKNGGDCLPGYLSRYILYFKFFIASASLFSVDVFVAFVVGEDRIAATVKIVLVLQPRQTN